MWFSVARCLGQWAEVRWRLRPSVFRGAGIYCVTFGEVKMRIDVDEVGEFTTKGIPPIPLGVYAKVVR